MDQTSDDVIDEQPPGGPLFEITVDAATLALLGINPEQSTTTPNTIPQDPGFNEEAWQAQLLVDIAILEAEEPLEGGGVPPDAGAAADTGAGAGAGAARWLGRRVACRRGSPWAGVCRRSTHPRRCRRPIGWTGWWSFDGTCRACRRWNAGNLPR